MYNLIVLAARPGDWTHEQFIDWWRGEHADVTYPLPGLRRWQHTELADGIDPGSSGWDGMSVSASTRARRSTALCPARSGRPRSLTSGRCEDVG